MASRRRRRKGIGKVITSVERKVRRIEKRPGAKRLKTNVVTTEKILPRAIVTKKIADDAVTANEAAFGVPVITDTEPTTNLKEGTLWVNPDDGAAAVYSTDSSSFIPVTDATAQSIAAGKNTTYVQANEPTGGTYTTGDLWIDIDDGNKLYAWSGTAWVARQDGDIAFAQSTADGKNTIFRQTTAPTGGTYASGDLWFDTDDNNKIYRFNGTNWSEAVQLGGNALANVNANSITAGTIDASVITVSNINAGNITTGKINTGLITVSTNPAGSGNTARVEMTSLGFFAYDGSVATVSITNTGTAVFSGTVNANGGNFTGFVTGGTMRFGAGVQTGKNGIYINANNYWYDTGEFQLGSGTSGVAFNPSTGALTIGSTATIAGTAASTVVSGASSGSSALQPGGTLTGSVASSASIAGTTASTVVSNAAEGQTALQPGNGVSDNASDQITSISTASGIVIGTRVDGTGARVEMNSTGFYAYDGVSATPTVSILNTGSASFRGTVTGSTFTSTNYTGGTGVALAPSGSGNSILFNVSGSQVADITTVSSGLVITSGSAQLVMSTVGSVVLSGAFNSLTMATAPYLNTSGGNTSGAYASLRNIFAQNAAPSGGVDGDVWLRWA